METDTEATADSQDCPSSMNRTADTQLPVTYDDVKTGKQVLNARLRHACIYLPALVAAAICIFFSSHVGIMPGSDYWGVIGQLLTPNGYHVSLNTLYALDNEHIIAVPKLIYLANALLTGGDSRVLTGITCLMSLGIGLMLASALARTLEVSARRLYLWPAIGFIAAVTAFTPLAAHNYFVGMSGVAWVSANLLTVAALYIQFRYQASYKALVVAVLLCLLAAQSYSSGVPTMSLLGIQMALQHNTRQRGLIVFVGGLILLAIIYLGQPSHHALGAYVFSPRIVAEFVAMFIGAGLTAYPDLAGIWGVIGLFLFSWFAIRAFWLKWQLNPSQALWVTLGGYAIAAALMGAIGRVTAFGPAGAVASRYATLPALFWLAVIGLALAARQPDREPDNPRYVMTVCVLACAAALTIIVGSHNRVNHLLTRATYKPGAALSVYLGTNDTKLLHDVITPVTKQLTDIRSELRSVGHVPFNGYFDQCPQLGSIIKPATSKGASPKGFVDGGARVIPDSTFVKLHGWVANADGSAYRSLLAKPRCIAFIDAVGVVQGLGIVESSRPDVGTALHSNDSTYGWTGYAKALTAPATLTAYARDSSNTQWYPLGNTLQVTTNKVSLQ
ncbi:MAG: hypothetical protein L0H70_00010 [Xanthomonadales bacterium]|nr:hypothetical protein [Xanthomonadales bacterium]